MCELKGECVVLFFSTSSAIRTEKIAKRNGMSVKLMPIPRHLSSDCGICLRIELSCKNEMEDILEQSKIDFDRIEEL